MKNKIMKVRKSKRIGGEGEGDGWGRWWWGGGGGGGAGWKLVEV